MNGNNYMIKQNQLFIKVLKTGLYTTIQDEGRLGYQDLGIPQGGSLDRDSANLANWLVHNQSFNPVLEITMNGPTLQFEGSGQIALTGADISASINGVLVKMNETLLVKSKDVLKFAALKEGCRCYMAVGGTWQIDSWLNSCSAMPLQVIELTASSLLKKGQLIRIQTKGTEAVRRANASLVKQAIANVEVFEGPEFDRFSTAVKQQFFNQLYTMTNRFDRMGCLLAGEDALTVVPSEIISSALLPGTIQITNAGQPIIMMQDAPVTGGYNRIAVLDRSSLNVVAQMCRGQRIQFVLSKVS